MVNGDILTDLDVGALVATHSGVGATIHLVPVEDPSAFGVADIDSDGLIRRFVEKPAAGEAPSNLINAGTYVMEPSVLDLVPEGAKVSVERVVFPALAAKGQLAGFVNDVYWLDTGRPDSLLQANDDLLCGRRRLARPAPPSTGVLAATSATIVRSSIGSGTSLGAGSTITGSMLFDAVRVGRDATVADSICASGSIIGDRAVVQDSVLGAGAVVAPGEHLVGARRPEG